MRGTVIVIFVLAFSAVAVARGGVSAKTFAFFARLLAPIPWALPFVGAPFARPDQAKRAGEKRVQASAALPFHRAPVGPLSRIRC